MLRYSAQMISVAEQFSQKIWGKKVRRETDRTVTDPANRGYIMSHDVTWISCN